MVSVLWLFYKETINTEIVLQGRCLPKEEQLSAFEMDDVKHVSD